MEHLIQLRSGVKTLNDDEFLNLISSFDKQYLTTILFNHFYHCFNNVTSQTEFNGTISMLQTFNNKISKIITSRNDVNKNEPKHKLDVETIQMDKLPLVLISEISSYLEFCDIKSFEICNRSVFIGCRSPISLYELPTQYSTKLIKYVQNQYHNTYFHWYRFNSLKKFEIVIDDYVTIIKHNPYIKYNYKLNNIPIWNTIQLLIISQGYNTDEELEFYKNYKPMLNFFNDFSNLKCNQLKHFRNDVYWMLEEYLSNFVSKNQSNNSLQFIVSYSPLKNIILPPTTRGFSIQDGDAANSAIIYSQIESLHLNRDEIFCDNVIKSLQGQLTNLKEICLHNPT
eukprot:463811_1